MYPINHDEAAVFYVYYCVRTPRLQMDCGLLIKMIKESNGVVGRVSLHKQERLWHF